MATDAFQRLVKHWYLVDDQEKQYTSSPIPIQTLGHCCILFCLFKGFECWPAFLFLPVILCNMQFWPKEFHLLAATRVTCSLNDLPLREGKNPLTL